MEAHLYEAHEQLEADHWWFEARRQIIEDTLKRATAERQGLSVLDIGCGTGGMAPMLSRFGALEGVEGSPDALERARRRFPGYVFHAGSLPDGLPEGAWDLITAFDVLEHLDQPVATLRQVSGRLKPDGAFVCTVPALPLLWSHHDVLNHHRRRYTATTLREHLEAGGLRVEWLSYFNSWLFPAVLGARLLGKLRSTQSDSDLAPVKEPLNGVLKALFASEKHVLKRARFPVGVSLIAITRRA
ncbi:MAG: class I SAM-dependent methyltransferase [Myxococcaceae bacterium]|nr:class I SAM-dependent methyltransferase [Myxococcaceae bacterium]